jgi:RNA polymerase sigma-54 factor
VVGEGAALSDGDSADSVERSADGDAPLEESWEGDGSVDMAPDDSEWGGDAPPRSQSGDDEETASAADLASEHVGLHAFLHEQARCLRLSEEDRAALGFLIESLNDDGYLEDSLHDLALAWLRLEGLTEAAAVRSRTAGGAGAALGTALHWLQHLEPAGVGARDLGECLRLQILELRNTPQAQAALAICQQPLELLARRDLKRLAACAGWRPTACARRWT